jgi:hypothetical protein
MAVLLITYEHKTAGKDYGPFFEEIKKSGEWWHFLDAIWIVDTNLTADALAHLLYPHMTKSDRLLVTKLAGDNQGWLAEAAWEWLNKRKV